MPRAARSGRLRPSALPLQALSLAAAPPEARPLGLRPRIAGPLAALLLLMAPGAPALAAPTTLQAPASGPSPQWRLAQTTAPLTPEAPAEDALPSLPLPWEQAVLSGLPPRQPWLAAGLSVAITGSGQFYNRDSTKGWWLFGTLATYPLAMAIDAWTGSGYARVSAFTLMMAAKGYSAWEAYHSAAASASALP